MKPHSDTALRIPLTDVVLGVLLGGAVVAVMLGVEPRVESPQVVYALPPPWTHGPGNISEWAVNQSAAWNNTSVVVLDGLRGNESVVDPWACHNWGDRVLCIGWRGTLRPTSAHVPQSFGAT